MDEQSPSPLTISPAGASRAGPPSLIWSASRRDPSTSDTVVLHLPGGGYQFSAEYARRAISSALARELPARVAALDYRVATDAPFPAAFEDAMAAWRALRDGGYAPERVALVGDSAGGGLALALTAALTQRGERPAAVAVFSPWTDLALTGGSLHRNAKRDPMVSGVWLESAAKRYLRGADAKDPRASPLYATFDRPPPTLFQVGSTEALKDDTLRQVDALRRSGGDVRLEILREAPHMLQAFEAAVPEAADAMRSACVFLRQHLAVAARRAPAASPTCASASAA